jgi:ketosteroid isomerase-like protein
MAAFNPDRFAHEWSAAWNARDLERILAHFSDVVIFSSPKAVDAIGRSTVRGKPALRDYWQRALAEITSLRFTVVRVIWDQQRDLAIVYDRTVNGRSDRALELLTLDPAGRVVIGEVFYGVMP